MGIRDPSTTVPGSITKYHNLELSVLGLPAGAAIFLGLLRSLLSCQVTVQNHEEASVCMVRLRIFSIATAFIVVLAYLIRGQLEPDPEPIPNEQQKRKFEGGGTLGDAAKAGALQEVRAFIEEGADVNQTDARGYTPLMLACERGHYISTLDLIKANSDISHRAPNGATPLSLAVNGNFKEIVQQLLKMKVDPDTTNRAGVTMLAWACQLNFIEMVRLLLVHGADVNRPANNNGDTALLMASTGGYLSVIELLLYHGAEGNVANNQGYTAIMMAAARGHTGVVQRLIEAGVDVDRKDSLRMTALDHAMYADRQEIITLLLRQGVDIGPTGVRMDAETERLWNEARARKALPETRIITNVGEL